jgi:putative transposase
LRRLYVLAFISISSRRVEYFTITTKPDTVWMLQQARNLLMALDDHDRRVRFLIHDRDAKFPRPFDALLESDGITVIRTPVRAPNANAHMERWVGAVRRECLDRLLILGRRQLEHILRVYVKHYNYERPHRALDLKPPELENPLTHRGGPGAARTPGEPARSTPRSDSRIRTRRSMTIEFLHDGSSPSEGPAKDPHNGASCLRSTSTPSNLYEALYGALRSETRFVAPPYGALVAGS